MRLDLATIAPATESVGSSVDWITIGFVAVGVVVLAFATWQAFAIRRVSVAIQEIGDARTALDLARRRRDEAAGTEVATAEDAVQAARRAVNAATREGEALRKRFPTSLYAGRIPEPRFEDAGGGTAEPPRIAF